MSNEAKPIHLLMAEDDPEDQLLVRKAFSKSRLNNDLEVVENGEELLDYLYKRGRFAAAKTPDMILLDLNMPRIEGVEALEEIKKDPDLRHIPVVVLTTSHAGEDILRSYDLGVGSYIEKPVTFEKLLEVVQLLGRYWFEIVKLPGDFRHGG